MPNTVGFFSYFILLLNLDAWCLKCFYERLKKYDALRSISKISLGLRKKRFFLRVGLDFYYNNDTYFDTWRDKLCRWITKAQFFFVDFKFFRMDGAVFFLCGKSEGLWVKQEYTVLTEWEREMSSSVGQTKYEKVAVNSWNKSYFFRASWAKEFVRSFGFPKILLLFKRRSFGTFMVAAVKLTGERTEYWIA